MAADEADPERLGRAADLAASRGLRIVRHVATDRARRVRPTAEALAVEGVVAHDGDHAADRGVEAL